MSFERTAPRRDLAALRVGDAELLLEVGVHAERLEREVEHPRDARLAVRVEHLGVRDVEAGVGDADHDALCRRRRARDARRRRAPTGPRDRAADGAAARPRRGARGARSRRPRCAPAERAGVRCRARPARARSPRRSCPSASRRARRSCPVFGASVGRRMAPEHLHVGSPRSRARSTARRRVGGDGEVPRAARARDLRSCRGAPASTRERSHASSARRRARRRTQRRTHGSEAHEFAMQSREARSSRVLARLSAAWRLNAPARGQTGDDDVLLRRPRFDLRRVAREARRELGAQAIAGDRRRRSRARSRAS